MDAKWTDKVESGKPVTVNFNGTVVTAQIGKRTSDRQGRADLKMGIAR